MKSFKEYKNEAAGNRAIYATFGRFNPPTIGHEKLFKRLKSLADADNADYLIYSSQSQDKKKNPLDYDSKIKFLRKMFPEFARHFVSNKNIKNALQIAASAYDEGYNRFVFVVGGDRIADFKKLLTDYNGKTGAHGHYDFKTIEVKSAGERDPDSEGVDGMSSSKLKAAAVAGDFDLFMLGMPKGFKDASALYSAVRDGLNVKEQSKEVDDVREAYISGNLFSVGDQIVAKSQSYVIVERHSNFVSAKSPSGEIKKFFLNQIELDESKVLEYGTTRAANIYKRDTPGQSLSDAKRFVESEKYYTGLSKSTAQKRKAHFDKQTKMRDDDPDAYKPAPGDSKNTKTSKYTKAYHDKYGDLDEDADAALKKKAEASGISIGILRQVYNRGLAAWKTGHRPGANQQQWGYARVNSFITGGKTRTTADADLWKKHKAMSESVLSEKKSETWEAGYERRVVKVTDPEKKAEGFLWRIKGKEKDNLTIKYYKTKPSFEEFSAQMRRVAGHEFGK